MTGQLSILTFRVRNLTVNHFENEQSARMVFQDLAQTHHDIVEYDCHILNSMKKARKADLSFPVVRLAKGVNGVFGLLLLDELLISTILVGLTIYTTIVVHEERHIYFYTRLCPNHFVTARLYSCVHFQNVEQVDDILSSLSYGLSVLLLIYSSCVAGEYLATEVRYD